MGNAVAFDSYAYVRKLRDAGLTEQQAAIQAEALVSLIEERLTTKKDLAEVEAGLKKDIEKIRADLQRDIKELDAKTETRLKELELRMIIKMGGMILAGIGILFGLMRAWPLPVQFVPVPGQEIRQTVPMAPPGGVSSSK
ncbi:MAG: hypothetical protein HQL79_00010 [Magnetococcales bacterium]|nr:hypothetical protein [Magnetococcales bacterium]